MTAAMLGSCQEDAPAGCSCKNHLFLRIWLLYSRATNLRCTRPASNRCFTTSGSIFGWLRLVLSFENRVHGGAPMTQSGSSSSRGARAISRSARLWKSQASPVSFFKTQVQHSQTCDVQISAVGGSCMLDIPAAINLPEIDRVRLGIVWSGSRHASNGSHSIARG